MVELVGALDELGLVLLDGQLHLHDDFVLVQDVHQDIFIALVESVLDSDDLNPIRLRACYALDLLVQSDDLIFLRGALAPKQITDPEGQELRSKLRVLFQLVGLGIDVLFDFLEYALVVVLFLQVAVTFLDEANIPTKMATG